MSEVVADVPLGSYVVLRAADGCRPPAAPRALGSELRVVLCHGWLQGLDSWLPFAQLLRDHHCADVLLVDSYGFGRSPALRCIRMNSLESLVLQVRRVMQHVGWDEQPVVFGGASMGSSIAMHCAIRHAGVVLGVWLMAPSGLPDPGSPIPHLGAALARRVLGEDVPVGNAMVDSGEDKGPLQRRWRSFHALLNPLKRTPTYGHTLDGLGKLLVDVPITVVLGTWDIIHTPQEATWKSVAPHADVVRVPRGTHWGICDNLGGYGLEDHLFWTFVKDRAQALASGALPQSAVCSRL